MVCKKVLTIVAVLCLISGSLFAQNNGKSLPDGSYYTCTMDPKIHNDAPGSCPICGMDLVKVKPKKSKPKPKPVATPKKSSEPTPPPIDKPMPAHEHHAPAQMPKDSAAAPVPEKPEPEISAPEPPKTENPADKIMEIAAPRTVMGETARPAPPMRPAVRSSQAQARPASAAWQGPPAPPPATPAIPGHTQALEPPSRWSAR